MPATAGCIGESVFFSPLKIGLTFFFFLPKKEDFFTVFLGLGIESESAFSCEVFLFSLVSSFLPKTPAKGFSFGGIVSFFLSLLFSVFSKSFKTLDSLFNPSSFGKSLLCKLCSDVFTSGLGGLGTRGFSLIGISTFIPTGLDFKS